ncbi:type IV toxin-antitoxin system AbiEi family antitoxin domain-containing protein [Micromonospora sp. NBC_01699]|uniref:type IV toxin-antitoxin system AbiEi family antitoxin domain-containing protein n=1 Tax=Micromonospora sp. NBC_01699 TaxID=2975984 RepID=UPI002E36C06F|nr:type IV toxin-antitoxin system AbiEi family antitoxin domain-containing protein [Micromonospora sp. NBC_01699]
MEIEGTFRYPELRTAGMSRAVVRHRVARGDLRRVTRGIYVPDPGRLDLLRAVFRRLPIGAVLGYQSAAALHGFGMSAPEAIHVIVPAGVAVPRIQGVIAHEAVLPVIGPVELAGVPCVPAARCAIDLARQLRRMDALPLLDAVLRSGACRTEELRAEVGLHGGLRGVCQARSLVSIADSRAECRQESQLRLVLIDAGLPVPEPQIWVLDRYGSPTYRLDLGYRERRVGLEYDGASHLDRNRLRYDRARMNWLAANRWKMRYFTAHDLYRRPAHIAATVRAALHP